MMVVLPSTVQFAILVGVLAYAAANLACLFHLSPRFRCTPVAVGRGR